MYGQGSSSSSSSSTLLIDVKDAAFAFATTSYSNNNYNDDAAAANNNVDDAYEAAANEAYQDYSSASCQPLDVDLSYEMFGDILDTATTNAKSSSSDVINFANAQLFVGPICRNAINGMWGVTVGVFADPDCSIYIPVLSDVMNGYGNNNNNNNGNGNGGEEQEGEQDNGGYNLEEVSSSISTAVQYINQAYQGEIGCGNNGNTCASILEASADFDTCSDNNFFFGGSGGGDSGWFGGGKTKHYQISNSQLSDGGDSTCAAVASAIEDTSSPAYSDYLQTLAMTGGMGQYTTNPNGSSSSSSSGAMGFVGVLFLVSLAVLMVIAVMLCKCIRIRRVRNETTGKDVLTIDVLKGGSTWFSPPSSPTSLKTATSPTNGAAARDGLMSYITSAFTKSPRNGTVAQVPSQGGDDGEAGADYQKYDESPIGSPTSNNGDGDDDSITRNRSADPTKTMKILKESAASYDTDVDANADVVAAASTYQSEIV